MKLKAEVSRSWMCLEQPEFVRFSLLNPILDRDSEHCAPLGTAQPSCAAPGVSCPRDVTMPWDGAAADPHQLPGLDGRAAVLREKAGAGQCKESAATPVSKLLGHRCCTPQMCRDLHPSSDPGVLGSSCPHQQQPKKVPKPASTAATTGC